MIFSRLELLTALAEYLWERGDTDRASELTREAILIMLDPERMRKEAAAPVVVLSRENVYATASEYWTDTYSFTAN